MRRRGWFATREWESSPLAIEFEFPLRDRIETKALRFILRALQPQPGKASHRETAVQTAGAGALCGRACGRLESMPRAMLAREVSNGPAFALAQSIIYSSNSHDNLLDVKRGGGGILPLLVR